MSLVFSEEITSAGSVFVSIEKYAVEYVLLRATHLPCIYNLHMWACRLRAAALAACSPRRYSTRVQKSNSLVGFVTSRNHCRVNEDAFSIHEVEISGKSALFAAVFDGHGMQITYFYFFCWQQTRHFDSLCGPQLVLRMHMHNQFVFTEQRS